MKGYIFADKDFLEQYSAQKKGRSSSSLNWKVQFNLLGQKVDVAKEGSDSIIGQIDHLLSNSDQILDARIKNPFDHNRLDQGVRLYRETTTASYGVLQTDKLAQLGIKALKIWFSDGKQHAVVGNELTHLVLIECYSADEGIALAYSGYSALELLLDTISGDQRSDRIHRTDDEDIRQLFSRDPKAALSEMGCTFGSEQKIETVYRLRAACMERDFVFAVGYPIFIATPVRGA